MSNRRVVAWYLVRDAECLTDVRKRLILLAFVSYEAVRLWWRGGSNGVVRQAVSVQIPPLPPPWPLYRKHPILRMGLSAEMLRQATNTKATSPRESLDPPGACCVLGGTRNGFLLTGSGAGAARFEAWCWPVPALPYRIARGFAPLRIRCFPQPRPRLECANWLPTCFRR